VDALIRYEDVEDLVAAGLAEDIGPGDITTKAIFSDERIAGQFLSREAGVLCGVDLAGEIVARHASGSRFRGILRDGALLSAGSIIAELDGPAAEVLPLERLLLNFMQRLSGIATEARRYVDAVAGTNATIYDTRKTTPGWRKLEKYAVRTGSACNHRKGLFDAALIKDNHIALARKCGTTLAEIIDRTRRAVGKDVFLEVEVDTLEQLGTVLECDVDAVLLDNMDTATLRRAVKMVRESDRQIETEASGGVTLENVASVAATGVDRISVGALTHSIRSLDISLDCRHDRS